MRLMRYICYTCITRYIKNKPRLNAKNAGAGVTPLPKCYMVLQLIHLSRVTPVC